MMDKQALLDLIAAELTVEQIMDILGWETNDLVDAIADYIVEYKEEFEQIL